jgi:hypothetical protein
VRVLPWLLDPELPWTIALPFARSVATLAIEAAILVGWPVGWALAAFAVVERGEARVLATLGESPAQTTARLVPQAMLLGCVLAFVSTLGARDATEPGRVLGDLLDRGAAACDAATAPTTLTVPFLGATWLCDPAAPVKSDASPTSPMRMRVLAGTPPGFSFFFTAHAAHVAPDLRRVDLDDAWLHLGTGTTRTRVHASTIALRGLPPFARASTVPPFARAFPLALAAAFAALAAVFVTLRRADAPSRIPARLRAIALGASGPLAALGLLRILERHDAPVLAIALALPLVSLLVSFALPFGADAVARLTRARRLPDRRTAASK